ncbi:MAG: RagB/SusD family nutrient uptake outer membrane protein, partial [Bacteroidales bacterium]|nr:RagB/SusD family nutrient uptake outer membrane protein [Bacteroidales bacterium]
AYFLRAFYYFRLVNQYGGVPLKLEPSEGIISEFLINTTKECFTQILDDLTKAAELLPPTSSDGHITKAAAWHFLAKAYLFRASERHSDITESTDLANAILFGLKVINKEEGTDRELAEDYHDFWNYLEEGVDGPAERSSEIILQAQYSNDREKFDRLANRTHLYYLPRYENSLTGLSRVIQYGRPYQRLRPTDYTYDVYDRVNDSRFWKSFRTLYMSTAATDLGIDIDGQQQSHVVGSTVGLKIIVNDQGDTRYNDNYKNTTFPNYWVRYHQDNSTSFATSKFAGLDKYLDPHRTGNQNDINGTRDGFLARIGETYLIVAEAYGRSNDFSNAVTYINVLRERAGYREGENRAEYRNATSSYFSKNTYYESTGVAETTASTKESIKITEAAFDAEEDAGIPYSVFGATSKEDKFIHFILNERTRELCGEFLRWEDLSRTETLHIRTIPFNLDAAAPQLEADKSTQKYLLRPIPQTFLDGVTKNGQPLSSEEKNDWQNPGY